MANFYALISHHDQPGRDDFYLKNQLPAKKLSIGWGEVNPIGSTAQKIKADIITHYENARGTNNPWNGEESLPVFCKLRPGDLVFVRGNAKILDIAIVTGLPEYHYGSGHDQNGFDYCTMIPFTPLLDNAPSGILTRDIPDANYYNVLEERGRRLVMRKLMEADSLVLLKSILSTVSG